MTYKILREVTTLENIEEATSEHALRWACRVEEQRSILNNIRETKDFDAIRQNTQWVHGAPHSDKCKYCGTGHSPCQFPAYRKKCGECGKDNHFKVVCRSYTKATG